MSGIHAIAFDAVGTLLHCDPPAVAVYAEVAARFGSRLSVEDIGPRFRRAFLRQEEIDRARNWLTDEDREYQRWRSIVAETLDDVTDSEAAFAALYDHFATPAAWRLDDDAPAILQHVSKHGLDVALASNFDRRLHTILEGLEDLPGIPKVFISSELRRRKPSPTFFRMIANDLGVPRSALLFVGDDLSNDYDGARAAGFAAVLLDPKNHHPQLGPARIERLADLAMQY